MSHYKRIELWETLHRPKPPKKRDGTLSELVSDMINFFEGFEYEDTAVIMSYNDYQNHKREFYKDDKTLQLNGIKVYLDGFLPNGHILITSMDEAQKILKTGT